MPMIDQVQTTRLANGLTILSEHMPGLRSISFGIWVRRGSRHELPALNGICHFIEHAVFNGSGRRHAKQIATESDRLRSEEHTSELQSHLNIVCRLLLEKKKKKSSTTNKRQP